MQMEAEKDTFRYGSKKEYERALVDLAQSGDDDEYEQLAEEYVRFMERDG